MPYGHVELAIKCTEGRGTHEPARAIAAKGIFNIFFYLIRLPIAERETLDIPYIFLNHSLIIIEGL